METIGFSRHDHGACISGGLKAVESECEARGLSLTKVRRRVLEILLARHRALGAYDILDTLREEGLGSQPPVAYRALEFLMKHGFVHKIERLNAYVACCAPDEAHAPVFLICRDCRAVAEAPADSLRAPLRAAGQSMGFVIERTVIEAEGLCPNCQEAAP